jgi:hypothetical protein
MMGKERRGVRSFSGIKLGLRDFFGDVECGSIIAVNLDYNCLACEPVLKIFGSSGSGGRGGHREGYGNCGFAAMHGLLGRASSLRSDAIGSQAELRCGAIRKTSRSAEERPSCVRVNRTGHPSRRF